jgi:hypothetical protein
MKSRLGLFVTTLLAVSIAWGAKPFANLETYKNSLGFKRYYSQVNTGRAAKIAVIDENFTGYELEVGKTLPSFTKFYAGSEPIPPKSNLRQSNGTRLAQLMVAMMTDDMAATQWIPNLTLYQVHSPSGLKNAISHILAENTDIVISAKTWDFGGNFDGTGFINAEVNRATQRGIVWINAAGDEAKSTFNSEIQTIKDDWVKLPDQNNALAFSCANNKAGKCKIEIALSWNDFKNDLQGGTNKDLDLALTDDMLSIVATSTLKQTIDPQPAPGFSNIPFEFISTEINAGTYFVRIKNRSKNFSPFDRLRITIKGNDIAIPSKSLDESLSSPADNSTVITVGANDSESTSTSKSLNKPDIYAPSDILWANGIRLLGSENAAALVAAGVGILKSQSPALSREDLLKRVTTPGGNWEQRGLSLNQLGFQPTGPGCFWDVILNPLPGYLYDVISRGGVPVETTAAIRIMVPFDPISLGANLTRIAPNDMIVALPLGGYAVFARFGAIPRGAAEVFQRPIEAGFCRPRPGGNGKNFQL